MSWNDGISKELSEFLTDALEIGEAAEQAFKSVIDEEVQGYESRITKSVPIKTGGLKASFTIKREQGRRNWYGYSAEFEGEAPNGEPYQKIANVLNYGRPAGENGGAITGTFFISRTIRRLKGLDERIEARIAAEIAKRS